MKYNYVNVKGTQLTIPHRLTCMLCYAWVTDQLAPYFSLRLFTVT